MTTSIIENIYYLGPDGSNTYNAMLKFIAQYNLSLKNKIPQKTFNQGSEIAIYCKL